MLYFKISESVKVLTPAEIKSHMKEVRTTMGIVFDNIHDAMRRSVQKGFSDLLTPDRVRAGLTCSLNVITDAEDNIIYRNMTILIKGYATDTEGHTVIFTDAGAITIVLD